MKFKVWALKKTYAFVLIKCQSHRPLDWMANHFRSLVTSYSTISFSASWWVIAGSCCEGLSHTGLTVQRSPWQSQLGRNVFTPTGVVSRGHHPALIVCDSYLKGKVDEENSFFKSGCKCASFCCRVFQHGSLCETTQSVTAAVALLSACLCVHFSSVCPLSGGVSV